jgi:DNA-directed RNA polymerase sigma subunit (sigma70/sigma32)
VYYKTNDADVSKINIEKMMSPLTSHEKLVIRSYFGIGSETSSNLEQVGKELNISMEQVRQIKNNALEKMERNFPAVQIAYCAC